MTQKKKTEAKAGYAATYKATGYAKNRRKRLERTIKAQPNNEQAKIALKNIVYRRKTPGTAHGWSATEIAVAKLFKEFTGSYNRKAVDRDPKQQIPAAMAQGKKQCYHPKHAKRFEFKPPQGIKRHDDNFSALGVRAHGADGRPVWS
jgi:hypothetical protein